MRQMKAFQRIPILLHSFTMLSQIVLHKIDLLSSFLGLISGRNRRNTSLPRHAASSHLFVFSLPLSSSLSMSLPLYSGAEPYIAPGPLDHADVQAGLSALPDYVTHLTETQLGILIERLSDSRYCHLLEVSPSPLLLHFSLAIGHKPPWLHESCGRDRSRNHLTPSLWGWGWCWSSSSSLSCSSRL
jgi:hypothetical protein